MSRSVVERARRAASSCPREAKSFGVRTFALNDREADLHLIEPTRMNRRMHDNDGRPLGLQTIHGFDPRWAEPWSMIQNTRLADRYGS